ncbi:MAG: DNA mismatch repair endonuclease MutL [Treponema sp.]|nr:DNA mismatch repair endonuclease MutL [Treponema sp.]
MHSDKLHSGETRIQVLPPEEARRIAAGEVIDRPAAIVRELLDNAIDANAGNIEVIIEEGGSKKIEVCDDGEGMSREDIELCPLTHATSKIRGLDDLDTARTLGFRGEALSSAAAVARLEIISSTDGKEAWQMTTGPGGNQTTEIGRTRRTRGTTVRSLNLFESIPARKRFLKREGNEAALCRQSFIDKTLAFTGINFRFIQDGKLKDFFPAVDTKKERFAAVFLNTREVSFLHELRFTGSGFSITAVIGGPQLYRGDRRQLFVFANGRRVQDYPLMQAMEYGAQGAFPNGTHPVGAVYIDIDPSLADFNIHPAKREVRFRDPGAIHHVITSGLLDFFRARRYSRAENAPRIDKEVSFHFDSYHSKSRKTGYGASQPSEYANHTNNNYMHDNNFGSKDIDAFLKKAADFTKPAGSVREAFPSYSEPRYAGRVFGLFILIEQDKRLFIIDQHAAHERILYNKFLSQPVPVQELLSPIPFRTESDDEDAFLETKRGELRRLGIIIEKDDGSWRVDALPSGWRMGDAETVKEILELRNAGENMAERWAAAYCCRQAIKDGDYPDDETAFALGKEALGLNDPRCPHGRPIWTEISRDALFRAVRRV